MKYGNVYVTRYKFGFPCEIVDEATLNSVDDSLKLRNKKYHLPHAIGGEGK